MKIMKTVTTRIIYDIVSVDVCIYSRQIFNIMMLIPIYTIPARGPFCWSFIGIRIRYWMVGRFIEFLLVTLFSYSDGCYTYGYRSSLSSFRFLWKWIARYTISVTMCFSCSLAKILINYINSTCKLNKYYLRHIFRWWSVILILMITSSTFPFFW